MFRCLKDGAEEFLLKPIRLADVQRLKASVTAGKQKQIQMQMEKHDMLEQPSVGQCNKRKLSSTDGFEAQSAENHPRLRALKVA